MTLNITRRKDLGLQSPGQSSGQFAAAAHDEAPPLVELTLPTMLTVDRTPDIDEDGFASIDHDSPYFAALRVRADSLVLGHNSDGELVVTAGYANIDLPSVIATTWGDINRDTALQILEENAQLVSEHFEEHGIDRLPEQDGIERWTATVTLPDQTHASFSTGAAALHGDQAHSALENFVTGHGDLVDELVDRLREDTCSCGTSLLDGEGFDGLCGNCADRASCMECGESLDDPDTVVCASCAREHSLTSPERTS